MSLRIKITIALVVSSLIAALAVGLIARWMVTRHLSDELVANAFKRYKDDVVAYHETYGSWQEALRREHFSAFVQRRRGRYQLNERTPLMPKSEIKKPKDSIKPISPLPLNPGAVPTKPPPKTNKPTPPVRFTLVDLQGHILWPLEKAGERVSSNRFESGHAIHIAGKLTTYALPDGEPQLSDREQAYLRALRIAFSYALALLLPLLLIIGLFWGYRLTHPLHHLQRALQAMQQGELKQQVPVKSQDEIGQLATSFNQMSTQLAKAYSDLEQAKHQAEAANRAKSLFLSNISHELRTPLNAVIGFARLSLGYQKLEPESRENLTIIQKNGEHLLQLINNVLSMAKIEAGKMELNQQVFDLRGLLNDVLTMFKLAAEEKGLRFELNIEPEVPDFVLSDASKLRQILINLLSNAIKFTERGGVNLQVYYQAPNTLSFEVIDTGIGIAEPELAKLFQAFEQTASGQQSKTTGTGLGLSLSKHFIELLDGEIKVQSTLGAGTAFYFNIRAEPSSQQAPAIVEKRVVALADDSASTTPPRILIVDDSHENRQLLNTLLKFVGFDVATATNGREAVAKWRDWQPQLIWMDLRMPEMDGIEATQLIKQEAAASNRSVVIIALSASAFQEDEAEVRALGFDDFLRKPYKEQEIFETMAQHLNLHYRYEETSIDSKPNPDTVSVELPLLRQQISILPQHWRDELMDASREADFFKIQRLIDDIAQEHEKLAQQLKSLLNHYDYKNLQRLLTPS